MIRAAIWFLSPTEYRRAVSTFTPTKNQTCPAFTRPSYRCRECWRQQCLAKIQTCSAYLNPFSFHIHRRTRRVVCAALDWRKQFPPPMGLGRALRICVLSPSLFLSLSRNKWLSSLAESRLSLSHLTTLRVSTALNSPNLFRFSAQRVYELLSRKRMNKDRDEHGIGRWLSGCLDRLPANSGRVKESAVRLVLCVCVCFYELGRWLSRF